MWNRTWHVWRLLRKRALGRLWLCLVFLGSLLGAALGWWGVALCLVETLFGSAQSCFEGLEFLGLGADSCLPGRGSVGCLRWRERKEGLLFMHCPVEVLDAAIQLEQAVELGHEVARYGAAGMIRIGGELC